MGISKPIIDLSTTVVVLFCFALSFLMFYDRFSWNPGWLQMCYVTEDDFELMIPLPLPPKCWDHRSKSLHGTRSGTQGSMHATQALYQLSCIPSSIALSFNSESLEEELIFRAQWCLHTHMQTCARANTHTLLSKILPYVLYHFSFKKTRAHRFLPSVFANKIFLRVISYLCTSWNLAGNLMHC